MARFHLGLETVFLCLKLPAQPLTRWVIFVHLLDQILLLDDRCHLLLRPVHVVLEALIFELLQL